MKPTAARRFRPKRYDKEYGAMLKEVGRNYASAAMIGNPACFQAATPPNKALAFLYPCA